MKKIMAGIYVGIIYIIVIGYMTSCTSRSSRNRDMGKDSNSRNPIGELTLYYPNGNDTTIIVSNQQIYSSSETMVYRDMDGIRNVTTLDFHYTQYRK